MGRRGGGLPGALGEVGSEPETFRESSLAPAGERLLVHRAVREELVARVAALVEERVVLGDPFAEQTTMGPLNNDGVADKMDEHVADALERGARLVHGGARADGFPTRLYWQPTVLDGVPADALVAREETFGPIAPVVEIDSLDQAIELANASPYGLSGSLWTNNLSRALRVAHAVQSGVLSVNSHSSVHVEAPFGGFKHSGLGRDLGMAAMEGFTELKNVYVAECPP